MLMSNKNRFKRLFRLSIIIIPILLLMVISTNAWATDIEVKVVRQAQTAGEKVFLRDIAIIKGPDCALKNDLGDVYITKAPEPGKTINIRRSYLEHRLLTSGLPLDQAQWVFPVMTVVSRESITITEIWVREKVEEYLSGIEPYAGGNWELISVRTGTLPKLPTGQLTYRTISNSATKPGFYNLTIFLAVNGKEADRVRVSGKVDLTVKAVVASKRLEKGQTIGPGDLRPVMMSASRLLNGALTDPSLAVGKVVKHRIQAGEQVRERDFDRKRVIKRGDVVNIVAKSGNLKVSSIGRAKQSGAVGDTISVVNSSSKRTVIAKVLSSDTVMVTF